MAIDLKWLMRENEKGRSGQVTFGLTADVRAGADRLAEGFFILTFLLICVFASSFFHLFFFNVSFSFSLFPTNFLLPCSWFFGSLSWSRKHQKTSRGVCMRGQATISTDNAQHTPPPHPSTLYRGTKAGPHRSGCSGLRLRRCHKPQTRKP